MQNTDRPLTATEALDLPLYERIQVQPVGRKTRRLALVTFEPEVVAGRTLVTYSYASGPAGTETLGSQTHVVVVSDASWSDKVWKAGR